MEAEYKPVWTTWHIVRPHRAGAARGADAAPEAAVPGDLRLRVQTARVQRRLSVSALAARVQTERGGGLATADLLAAFERGEQVLAPEIQRAVRRALDLG